LGVGVAGGGGEGRGLRCVGGGERSAAASWGVRGYADNLARATPPLTPAGPQPTPRPSSAPQGIPARQHDAWDLGFTTDDNFGNADILYEDTLPRVRGVGWGSGGVVLTRLQAS
jgi:hypothetical protein